MFGTANLIRNTRRLLWIWFALLALSPCVVKEAVFSAANSEFAKPLNKSKTTNPVNPCVYSLNDSQRISVGKQARSRKQTVPAPFSDNKNTVEHVAKIARSYTNTFSGNSPPMYILFKRLKLDVV